MSDIDLKFAFMSPNFVLTNTETGEGILRDEAQDPDRRRLLLPLQVLR